MGSKKCKILQNLQKNGHFLKILQKFYKFLGLFSASLAILVLAFVSQKIFSEFLGGELV